MYQHLRALRLTTMILSQSQSLLRHPPSLPLLPLIHRPQLRPCRHQTLPQQILTPPLTIPSSFPPYILRFATDAPDAIERTCFNQLAVARVKQ